MDYLATRYPYAFTAKGAIHAHRRPNGQWSLDLANASEQFRAAHAQRVLMAGEEWAHLQALGLPA